jgi:hypothetical protein
MKQYKTLGREYAETTLPKQYEATRQKIISVFGDIKPKFERGFLPKETLALLAPDRRKPSRRGGSAESANVVLEELAVVLALDGFLDNSESPEWRESLRQVIDDKLNILRRDFYRDGESWPVSEKRESVARLLWAHIVRDEKHFEEQPALLDYWWLLLQDFENLQPSGEPPGANFVEFEANSLSNIMRFVSELEVLAHLVRRGSPATDRGVLGSGMLQSDLLDELRGYVRDILVERMPIFCEQVALLLEKKHGKKGVGLSLVTAAISLKVLLQYHKVALGPGIRRLQAVDSAVRQIREMDLGVDGCYYPNSPRWRRYREKCESVGTRLGHYVEACSQSGKRDKLKPFVILVVGEPGTGKSQFVDSIVRPRLGTSTAIFADLSQSNSISRQLDSIWKVLHLRNKSGIALLVLEEFDSEVGVKVEQYRQVLRPLWDAQSYVVDPDGVETVSLGPFVAVCVMSKIATFASARRILTHMDKGLDFLTRVDVVVEIPPFDSVKTQVELILASLGRRASRGNLRISQVALWFLGWLQTGDNFRAVSKALKNIGDSVECVSYEMLNVDPSWRLDFETLLMEFGQIENDRLKGLILLGQSDLSLEIRTTGRTLEFICTQCLGDAFHPMV